MSTCFKCNNVFGDTVKCVQCDGCKLRFHYDCTELASSEIRPIELKTERSLKYFREVCQEGLRLTPILQRRIETLETSLASLEKLMNSKFDEIINKVPDTYVPVTIQINDIIVEHLSTQNQQNSLKLNSVVNAIKSSSVDLVRFLTGNKPPNPNEQNNKNPTKITHDQVNQAINSAIVAGNQTKKGLNNGKNSLTNGQSGNGSKNGKNGKYVNSDKDVNTFEGVPHREWTYVGNAAQNVTIDIIRKFIIQKGIQDNDNLIIIQLNSSGKTKSFKVGLINGPNFWPDSIITHKFDNRK